MRPVLAWPNWSDSAAITGSTALTGCPLANLKTKQPKQIWASANVTSAVYMELDRYLTTQPWNTVSVLFANATRNATWRVRAATSQANLTAAPSYDHGAAMALNGSTQYATQSFTSTGTLQNLTIIGRARATTMRTQGLFTFTNGSTGPSIIMDGSGSIFVNPASGTSLTSTNWLTLNKWVHIAVVVTGGTVADLYIDGVKVHTQTNWVAQAYSAVELAHTSTNRLAGTLDDVALYTSALTADEVLADFERFGDATYPQAGLYCYYRCGSTANNGSVGGVLTLAGSPTYTAGARFTASPFDRLPGADRRHSLLWVPAGVTYQWLRIDIDDPTNTDTVFEAGRVVVGDGWQFRQSYPGNLPSFTDDTQVEILPGGQSAINAGTPVPSASVNIRADTEAEMLTYLYDIAARRGSSKDVLLVRDPDPAFVFREHGMCYGLVQNGLSLNLPEYGRFESKLEVRGLL